MGCCGLQPSMFSMTVMHIRRFRPKLSWEPEQARLRQQVLSMLQTVTRLECTPGGAIRELDHAEVLMCGVRCG